MAGKRQHYIPQLLQRGFLDSVQTAELTWLHRRGSIPRLVGIRDVGVEDWFYSRRPVNGQPTLDDAITKLEQDLGAIVASYRKRPAGDSVDAAEASRTLVHLVMRTAHLRRLMSASIDSMFSEVQSLLTNPTRLGAMIGTSRPAFSSIVSDGIRRHAQEMEAEGMPAAFSERIIGFMVREFGDRLVEQATTALGPLLPVLLAAFNSEGIVRDQHNSVLGSTPESVGWVAALVEFDWTVELAEDLILPDAVALAKEQDGPLTPILFSRSANVTAVLMPIAKDRMLVGRRTPNELISFGDFNEQAAANCEAFFISAKRMDHTDLIEKIGSAPANAINSAVSAAINEAEEVRSRSSVSPTLVRAQEFSIEAFTFSIRLADFGDEILANKFKDVLQGVVGQLAREMPLHELDGFTLANDYTGILPTIDRGDSDLPPVTTGALEYGVGFVMPITVMRDGIHKQHLVFASGLAEMWLSPDAEVRAAGLHALVSALAGVAHSSLYSAAHKTSYTPDAIGREFHLAVAGAPVGYWSARKAAFVAPNQGKQYADLVVESLDFADRTVAEESARVPNDGNIDRLMTSVLRAVSAVICHAGDWLGHRDGLVEGYEFSGMDLPEKLKDRGLENWIELFGRDLAACYKDEAIDLEVATSLSSHVERLLWSLGIYCWPDGDSTRCLVTENYFRPPSMP